MRRLSSVSLLPFLALLATACGDDTPGDEVDAGPDAQPDAAVPNCEADPPDPAALLPAGSHPEGGWILIGGRRITPAGRLVQLSGLPVHVELLPTEEHLLVTEAGWYPPHRMWLIDALTGDILTTVDKPNLFNGVATTPDGSRIYVGGGDTERIYVFDFVGATDTLIELPSISVPDCWVGALALTPDGSHLLAADNDGKRVYVVDLDTGATVADPLVGDMPYDIHVDAARDQFVVSLWGDEHLSFVSLSTWEEIDQIETGKNPESLVVSPDGDTLYVVNSDSDTLSEVDLATRTVTDTIQVGVWHASPRGISPNHLALTPDGESLLVSSAGTNSVEVFDRVTLEHIGSIPTAWYPTGITTSPLTDEVFILNSKGTVAGPSGGENPRRLMAGNLQIVPLPTDAELAAARQTIIDNNERMRNLEPTLTCDGTPGVFPVPLNVGGPTPIEHVVLIVRENKTYDSQLGDLGTGNGDPDLAIFGEWHTPNLHALARQFTSLDNYFTNGEVSLQGHHWLTSVMNNDFFNKAVPMGNDQRRSFGYFTGHEIGWPEGGFIWGYLYDNGVDFVDYGEGDGVYVRGALNMDMDFPGIMYNLTIKDVEKAEYVASRILDEGFMPTFTYLLLPNNHTEGSEPGKPTPASMIADNDEGTGIVVEAISHSRFWERTAIFIVEDDALQGGDHVETHRSICLVVSPWAKRGYTSSVHADIPAVWKTIWLIIGLDPMGIFDTNAAALYDSFTAVPDFTPYDHLPRNVPEELNSPDAWGARRSQMMDFSIPDQARGLPRLLWEIFTGTEAPWPAARRLSDEVNEAEE